MNTNINLKDTLTAIAPETRIKIGAVDGFSYFFCGTAKTFLEFMDETYTVEARQFFEKHLATMAERFDDMRSNPPQYPEKYMLDTDKNLTEWLQMLYLGVCDSDDEYTQRKVGTIRSFLERWTRWMSKTEQRRRSYKAAAHMMEAFVPYADRKVVDSFVSSVDDEDGVVIIQIEGYECGNYWPMTEARNKPDFALKAPMSVTALKSEDEPEEEEAA